MEQDLIITSIHNDHAKTIIARLLSQKQQIPLQQALQIVNRPPFVFLVNLSIEQVHYYVGQIQSIGVLYKLVNSQKPQEETHPSVPMQNSKIDLQRSVPNVNSIRDNLSTSKIYLNKSSELKSKPESKVDHHLSSFESNEKPKKKSKVVTYVIIAVLFSLPITLICISINQKSSLFLSKYSGQIDSTSVAKDQDKFEKNKSKKKQIISSANRVKSDSYVDSAQVYADNVERAINFYKLAISINKYNYKAWYGLVNTYTNAQRYDEAREAQKQMKIIFGEQIFTIESIVEPYGTIINTRMNEDNSYYLEYKSEASNKKTLMNEIFQIVRALKPECSCSSISIFASQTAGTGMVVHIKKEALFNSIEEFKNTASITYLE